MATDVSGNIKVVLGITETDAADLSIPIDEIAISKTLSFTNGTGANQANCLYHDGFDLAASATKVIGVSALVDKFGNSKTATKIKAVYLYNGGDQTLTIEGGPLVADTSDKIKILAGGILVMVAPGSAGFGSATDMTITNTSGSNACNGIEVLVLGVTA